MATTVTREDLVTRALDEAKRYEVTIDAERITRYVRDHIPSQPIEALLDTFASFARRQSKGFDPDVELEYNVIEREISFRVNSQEN